MINIYHETDKSIGFIFLLFEDMKSNIDYREFETESQKINFLNENRRDLILYNLETFVCSLGKHSVDTESIAEERLRAFISWSNENTEKMKLIFTHMLSIMKFVDVLIESADGHRRQRYMAIGSAIKKEAELGLKTFE